MSATLTIPEAAQLLGVSRNTAYEDAKSGQLAGVQVISIGRRLVIPRAPLLEILGISSVVPADEVPRLASEVRL